MRYLLRYLLNIQSIRATYAKMDSRFNKKLGVLLCENFVVYFRMIFSAYLPRGTEMRTHDIMISGQS